MLWKCLTWILLLLILTIKGSKIIFNKAIFIIESYCVIIIMDWEHMVSLFVYFRFKERVYMELIICTIYYMICAVISKVTQVDGSWCCSMLWLWQKELQKPRIFNGSCFGSWNQNMELISSVQSSSLFQFYYEIHESNY